MMIPATPDRLQMNSPITDEDAAQNELAGFLTLSGIIAKKFHEVISDPAAFFNLSKSNTTQFNNVLCSIPGNYAEDTEARLNLIYTSQDETRRFHHETSLLYSRTPQAFGFRVCRFTDSTVILSFPNNKLFNSLLSKLPSVYSFAIRSTYPAVGEVSPKTHVTEWIESGSWPYDGNADNLDRIKNTYHDAHHIMRSLQCSHLHANVLLFLKSRLKELNKHQLFKNNAAPELSNILELLHNEGSNEKTKYFYIDNSKIQYNSNIKFISEIFTGIMNLSDFPMDLKETTESYKQRGRFHALLFPYPS